jgi:hypothetical protein
LTIDLRQARLLVFFILLWHDNLTQSFK